MPDHIITPKQSWLEKLKSGVKSSSPQVKQGLIGAGVALLIAIGGCVSVYSENSRLKSKVHDLELEVLPFRNLAVQQFNKADADSLKKLAESMAALHKSYSNELEKVNALRSQVEELKKANEEAERNLFSRVSYERISISDTNRFIKHHTAEGAWRVCMLLKSAPLPGSLQGSIQTSLHLGDNNLKGPHDVFKNVFIRSFWGEWGDFQKFAMSFDLQFVPDLRETNLIKRVQFLNDDVVLFDGVSVRLK